MTYVKEKAFDDKKEEERHLKGKENLCYHVSNIG